MRSAGVVLVGGRSVRMGQDKASLPWGATTMLDRVCAVLAESVDGPVVVVRAEGQPLPTVASRVEIVDDPVPGQGPVRGLAAGLLAIGPRAEVAFVAATDLPRLRPSVVRRVLALLEAEPGADVAVPVVDGYPQLLAAAYRTELGPSVLAALEAGEQRLGRVVAAMALHLIPVADLLGDPAVVTDDPHLESFLNVNDPQQYAHARDAHRG